MEASTSSKKSCEVFRKIFGTALRFSDRFCKTGYGKVLWLIISTCLTILTVYFTLSVLVKFVDEVVLDRWIIPVTTVKVYDETEISPGVVFQQMYRPYRDRVYNKKTGKVTVRRVDWAEPFGDTLTLLIKKDKYGFINRYTGEVAIPVQYEDAWMFSEGLAAVEKDGKIMFIDHTGKVVIDGGFMASERDYGYAFKGGYCNMRDPQTGKAGIIDKNGNWVLDADFDKVDYVSDGFWKVRKDDLYGLYTADLKPMFPIENMEINFFDNVIEVRRADHTASRYDMEGNVLVDFVIDKIENLQYATKQVVSCSYEESSNGYQPVYDVARCRAYMVEDRVCNMEYYGLMSPEGKLITPPEYSCIEAVGADLYLCHPDGVLINGRGEKIEY